MRSAAVSFRTFAPVVAAPGDEPRLFGLRRALFEGPGLRLQKLATDADYSVFEWAATRSRPVWSKV